MNAPVAVSRFLFRGRSPAGPLLLECFDCKGERRSIEVLAAFRERDHCPYCRLKCHLIGRAEAVCGSKFPMEAQHCLSRANADTSLDAQPLPSVGALAIEAAGREEIRRAGRVLRGSLGSRSGGARLRKQRTTCMASLTMKLLVERRELLLSVDKPITPPHLPGSPLRSLRSHLDKALQHHLVEVADKCIHTNPPLTRNWERKPLHLPFARANATSAVLQRLYPCCLV